MRIGIDCHVVGSRVGGNESYIVQLVRALARIDARNEYRLYVVGRAPEIAALGAAPNCSVVRLAPRTSVVRIPVSLPFELWRHPVDVLHVQYIPPPIGRTPVVNMVHDLGHFSEPQYFRRREVWRQRLLLPRAVRRAAKILTVSRHSQEEIVRTLRVPAEQVVVTYPGVSDAFVPIAPADRERVLARYRIAPPYLLYVGNIQPRKNVRGLIDAFALLKQGTERLPHRLVIVGRGAWLYADVFQRVRELGLESQVTFTSYVPDADLPALYSGADVFVYPSFFEGFGSPPLEAMRCGTPVVVSNRPAFPEILGDAALRVEPTEPRDIARGILAVLRDLDLRASLIARGHARARLYPWDETARQTLAVFEEVGGGGGVVTPIRVAFIAGGLNVGGAERQLLNLAHHIDRERFTPLVIDLRRDSPMTPLFRSSGVEVIELRYRGRYDWGIVGRIRRVLVERRIQVACPYLWPATAWGYAALRLAGLSRWVASERSNSAAYDPPLQVSLESRILARAPVLVAISEAARDFAIARGVPPERVTIIRIGVRPPEPTRDPRMVRADLGLAPDVPIVGSVARFGPQKDYATLLRAARLVLERIPEVRFVLVGDGPLRAPMERLAGELGIAARVQFVGMRLDAIDLLNSFDVAALASSRQEGCSNFLVESAWLAKPAVATAVGGIPEAVQHGTTGLLVTPGDPGAMAAAIVTLLGNPGLAQRMGAAAATRARTHFGIPAMVAGWERVLAGPNM